MFLTLKGVSQKPLDCYIDCNNRLYIYLGVGNDLAGNCYTFIVLDDVNQIDIYEDPKNSEVTKMNLEIWAKDQEKIPKSVNTEKLFSYQINDFKKIKTFYK